MSASTGSSAEPGHRFGIALALICAAGLLLHLAVFARSGAQRTQPDSDEYVRLASQIIHGGDYAAPNGEAETRRPPVYPLFLALFGIHPDAVVIAQHLLIVAGAAAVAIWLRGITGLLAAALIALDTTTAAESNFLMADAIFPVILICAAIAAVNAIRRRSIAWALAGGVLAGLAPLTRPIAVLIVGPLALAAIVFAWRRPAIVLALLLPAIVLPAAWIGRNYARTGVATVSSIGGVNMLYTRAAGSLTTGWHDYFAMQTRLRGPELSSIAKQSELDRRRGLAIIAAHPYGYARRAVEGAAHLIFEGPAELAFTMFGGPARDAIVFLLGVLRIAIVVAVVIGLVTFAKHDPLMLAIVGGFLAYLIVISAGPEAIFITERFRTPLIPFESIAASFGAVWAWNRLRRT